MYQYVELKHHFVENEQNIWLPQPKFDEFHKSFNARSNKSPCLNTTKCLYGLV